MTQNEETIQPQTTRIVNLFDEYCREISKSCKSIEDYKLELRACVDAIEATAAFWSDAVR